jgi:hypothetical protein
MTKSRGLSWQASTAILITNLTVLGATAYSHFDANDYLIWGLSFFGLFQIYGICRYLVSTDDEIEWARRRAWILTFFAALVLVIQSVYFLTLRRVLSNLLISPDPIEDILYLTYLSPIEGRMAAIFFSAHCFLDLLVGMIDYPEHVGLLPGWIHHSFFIFFLPLTLFSQIEGGFLLLCPNEIPTLILALGQIIRPLRQDLLFGILFFLIRVVYTVSYTILILTRDNSSSKPFLLFITIPICLLHILWFRDWFIGYTRRKRESKDVVKNESESVSERPKETNERRNKGGAGAMPEEKKKKET